MESDGMGVNFESDADTCKAHGIEGDIDIKDAPASVDVLEEDYAMQNKPKRTKHHHEMGSDGMGVNFESDANTCKDHWIKGMDMVHQIMFHRPIITRDMIHMEMPMLRLRADGEKKGEPNSLMRTRAPLLVGEEKEQDKMESNGMGVKSGSDADTCNYHGIIGKKGATILSVYSSKSSAIIPSATFGSSTPSCDKHILDSAYLIQDPRKRKDMLKQILYKKQREMMYEERSPSVLLCGALKARGEKRGEPNSSMINRAGHHYWLDEKRKGIRF